MPSTTPPDYDDFRFEAVVDRVWLQVTLQEATQPQWLQHRMPRSWFVAGRPPWVKAHTDEPSRTSKIFSFIARDPAGPSALLAELQSIVPNGCAPLTSGDVKVWGAEIALDAYSRKNDPEALNELLCEMILRQYLVPSGIPLAEGLGKRERQEKRTTRSALRASNGTFSSHAVTLDRVRMAAADRASFNAGERDADFTRRWYLKSYDSTTNRAYEDLPVDEWRVRSEVALLRERAPFTTLEAWREYRFQDLQTPYFRWCIDNRPPDAEAAPWLSTMPSLSMPEGSHLVRNDRRKTRPGTAPDRDLNRHAKNALERLTRQQRRR